jgi:SWI/SNF-related matrix-associated actin-dependent regulator 1 of chromatin subfamily A
MIQIREISTDFVYFNSDTKEAISLGATYLKGKHAWRIPINLHSVRELLRYTDNGYVVDLHNKLQTFYNKIRDMKHTTDAFGDKRLRPYQRVDIGVIQERQSIGIFNEQRTGKTPTTLVADKDSKKRIIVCPSGLKLNWKRELKNWLDEPNVFVVSGTPIARKKIYKNFELLDKATLIMSYETLRQDILVLPFDKFDSLIVDESHRLRNYMSKQSKAVILLSESAYKVYALTGTPAVNHPSDIYGIYKLLKPQKYTSYWAFVDRYFGVYDTPFGKEVSGLRKDREEEFLGLVEVQSVQRKRRDVMKWLPKVQERDLYVPPTATQKKLFTEIVELSRYNGNVIPNAISQLMRLRQASLHPMLLGVEDKSPKLDFLLEYLEDNPKERVLVFSMFTSFLKILKDKIGAKASLLTGEQSQAEKQKAVDDIQNGVVDVLLANLIAGGTGWTLDQVDTIIFTDISYNPMDNEQAKDRFIPTKEFAEYGGKQIIYLLTEGSIDDKMYYLVKEKFDFVKLVNDYGLKHILSATNIIERED